MNSELLNTIHADQLKDRPDIQIGDTVKLSLMISEGERSRTQIFEGIVIAMKGTGLDATITVRKLSSGIGVERIVPLHSPTLQEVEVVKRGKVRRSKLYYMRDRVGKRAMKINRSQLVNSAIGNVKNTEDKSMVVEEPETTDVSDDPSESVRDE